MSIEGTFTRAARAVLRTMGRPAVYVPANGMPYAVRAAVHHDVQLVGEAQVIERRTVLHIEAGTLIDRPRRGDEVQVGDTVYRIDAELANDGHVIQVVTK